MSEHVDPSAHAHRPRRRHRLALVSLGAVTAISLLAAACARDQSTSSPVTAPAATANTEKPAGPPKTGGQLEVGLAAETNSYNPSVGQWSAASYEVANAIFDPLAAIDAHGEPQPYLAKGITPNADFTSWTITLRPGITFQDGEPLDANAVKKNLDTTRSAGLTSQAFTSVQSITATDAMTVVVAMNQPWSTYPAYLTLQSGYMASPAMLDDPAGADAKPIGTGPFQFADRQIDAFLKTTRNPHYWQKDSSGAQLPYLDGVEFKIITDSGSRTSAMNAGDINAAQVLTPDGLQNAADATSRGDLQEITDQNAETDESVIGFNTSKAPFNDPVARQAIATAIDQETLAQVAYNGVLTGAWGMFEQGSPYYITKDQAGYPKYDPDKAKQLATQYQQAHGAPLTFSVLVTPDPQATTILQAYQAELGKVGIKMDIMSVETTQLITKVIVSGDYQAAAFVMWSSPSVDQGYIFVATKANPNGLSLNYPRFDDPDLTAAYNDFRATTDQAKRVAAMTRVQQGLAKDLQMLFLAHLRTAIAYRNNVHGFRAGAFPDSTDPAYSPYPITPFYTRVWVDPS
jgi:ABC-type transport system substrate-binding protein